MALDAAHRSSIYHSLVPILGEEDANVLLSEFPSAEGDELVTKDFLRAELAELRTEFKGDITALRTELEGDIAGLRTELKGDIAGLKGEIAELRTEVHALLREQTRWLFTGTVGAIGVTAALVAVFG